MNENMYKVLMERNEFHWYLKSKRIIITNLVKAKINKDDNKKNIADFGCGGGLMLESLSKISSVTGFDYNPEVISFCEKKYPELNFKVADLESDDLSGYNFDMGVCLDMLEHIGNDLEAAKNIHNALKYDSYCVITVPALKILWSKFDENLNHKRRYKKKELKKLLENAGFTVEYISYYNFWFFPVVLTIRIVTKLLNINKNSELETNFKDNFIYELCFRIMSSEDYYIKKRISFPIGVSLVALVKKIIKITYK